MLQVNIPICSFLRLTLSACETDRFAAMIIPLARAADITQPEISVRDFWESLHDVTGDSILVACPSGDGDYRSGIIEAEEELAAMPEDLLFTAPKSNRFARAFWSGIPVGQVTPSLPSWGSWKQLNWTNSVRTIAHFFCIAEYLLPAILVVDFRTHQILAVSIPRNTSLYDFCKSLVEQLRDEPHRLAESEESLRNALSVLRQRQREMNATGRDTFIEQLSSAATHINAADAASTELYGECRRLLEIAATDASHISELLDSLNRVHDHLVSSREQNRRTRRKVWKLIRKIESQSTILPIPGNASFDRTALNLDAAKQHVENARSTIRRDRSLAEGIEASTRKLACELVGPVALKTLASPGELRDLPNWTIRSIRAKRPEGPARPVRPGDGGSGAEVEHDQPRRAGRDPDPEPRARVPAALDPLRVGAGPPLPAQRRVSSRRRSRQVAIVSLATALVTSGIAILINYSTGQHGSLWSWAAVVILTIASAVIGWRSGIDD